jgi:hypothetical protein
MDCGRSSTTWATAVLILLSLSAPLSALDLDEAAIRERGRRESAAASASKVFTDEDLQRYVGPGPLERAAEEPADWSALRQTAHWRHWASAASYLRQCAVRLSAAEEWLAFSEANPPRAVPGARRAVESAGRSLERAREYRDRAEMAARRAGIPGALVR